LDNPLDEQPKLLNLALVSKQPNGSQPRPPGERFVL